MLEWGAKLFYFDRRKCIQLCHFASKLTILLIDIKKADLESIGEMLAMYLLNIYSDDKEMISVLRRWFKEYTNVCFAKITDRSIISTMNYFQSAYLDDGYQLYNFIYCDIFDTVYLNRKLNEEYCVTEKN